MVSMTNWTIGVCPPNHLLGGLCKLRIGKLNLGEIEGETELTKLWHDPSICRHEILGRKIKASI